MNITDCRRSWLLRLSATIGVLAVIAQLLIYNRLSKRDVAGVYLQKLTVESKVLNFTLSYPNTWNASIESTSPEVSVELSGPDMSRFHIFTSSANRPQKFAANRLKQSHESLRSLSSIGMLLYSESEGVVTRAKPAKMISLFSGKKDDLPIKGFRTTMIINEQILASVAYSTEKNWKRSLLVMKNIDDSILVGQ